MKRAILVVSNETEVTGELEKYANQFAQKHDAEIIGCMKYSEGLPIQEPEGMLQGILTVKPDIVIAGDPDFVIEEILRDNHIGNGLKNAGIEFYDLHLDIEMEKIMETVPQELLNEVKNTIEKAKRSFSLNQDKENYLIIAKQEDKKDVEHYINGIATHVNLSKVCKAEMNDYYPEMEVFIQDIIDSNNITNVVLYSTYASPELEVYMNKLSSDGVNVINKEQQDLELDMCPKFSGMMMN